MSYRELKYDIVPPFSNRIGKRHIRDKAEQRPSGPRKEEKYLGEYEMKYLLEGDSGSHTNSQLEEQIEQKRDSLGVRIQRLVNDIAIMEYGGCIEERGDLIEDLPPEQDFHSPSMYASAISDLDNTMSRYNSDRLLGYNLGLALRILSGSAGEGCRGASFFSGLIQAYSATESGYFFDEKTRYRSIQDNLEGNWNFHILRGNFNTPDNDGEKYSEIKKALRKFGIEPTSHAVSFVRHFAKRRSGNSIVEVDAALAHSIINDRIEKESLKECVAITTSLEEEWDNIDKASAPGVTSVGVLKAVWNSDETSSLQIAGNIYTERHRKPVTQSLNKLSEEGKNPHSSVTPMYKHGSIVRWISPPEQPGKWILTDYGRLLCYYAFEMNQEIDWIHRIKLMGEPAIGLTDPAHEELQADLHFMMRGARTILEGDEFDFTTNEVNG